MTGMATEVSELKKLLLDENTASKNKKSRQEEEQSDTLYFYEDEIFKFDKKGRVKFGLVIETEPYSDDDDDADADALNKGEVLIAWYPEGRENVQSERTIGLVDRSLMPGDVVRRLLPGKDTQRGYCREVSMRADVKVLGTKYVIKNVPGERLRLITSWQRDSAVCLDSWVGSTKDFEEKAILRSTAGSRIEVSSSDLVAFKEASCPASRGVFIPHIFYPGNVVVGQLYSLDNIKLLTPKIPLATNKKGKPLAAKFVIESVFTEAVWVHWQYRALSDTTDTNSFQQPNPCVTGEDLKRLKRLNLFEPCMLQINDRNYITYSAQDEVVKKTQWDKEQAEKFKVILSEQQKEENENLVVHSNGPNAHHFEKLKKKMSFIDADKTSKLKKCAHKDKLSSNSSSKEKQPSTENVNCSTPKSISDTEWMSDDDEYVNGLEHKCMEDGEDEDDEQNDSEVDGITANECKFRGANRRFNSKDSTTTTLSTCSSPSPHSSPRHDNRRQLKKTPSKTLKKSINADSATETQFVQDEELITEALLVYSTATVVWQDGSVEYNIQSTQLYPIHHLDNHEFFPGDFVISGKEESDVSFRDYGVIQTVDHHGRTARVKWFTTYTSTDEPKPAYKGESEVSVYDLKDHPDFQYRPGTMVIRVANFVGEDATCTAGQIIDNYIDGRVKVWWVDGHISMCWPQDLFEVGQYDHADWGHESDDSWETESENSEFGDSSPNLSFTETHILANIERGRVAIARLEEILTISPNLQSLDVMRKLLNVYKGCRYLDRLLNTNFFHEDNFAGLIERVRKGGTQSLTERAQVRKNRLFSGQQTSSNASQEQQPVRFQAILTLNGSQKLQSANSYSKTSTDYAPKVLLNMSSTSFKFTSNSGSISVSGSSSSTSIGNKRKFTPITTVVDGSKEKAAKAGTSVAKNGITASSTEPSPAKQNSFNTEKNELLTSAMLNIEKAFEKTSQLKYALVGSNGGNVSSQDDSGNYSIQNCDGSSNSYASSSDLTNAETNNSMMKVNDDQKSISCSSIELTEDATSELFCVRLCTLLKNQLVKCIGEIREKYYKNDNINLSEVFEYDFGDEESTQETVVDVDNVQNSKMHDDVHANGNSTAVNALQKSVLEQSVEPALNSTATVQSPLPSNTLIVPPECFQILPNAPITHKFHLTLFHPNNSQQYYKAVQKEHRLLKNSMPPGVWVRVFEDRMDLLSVMIEGPKKTPYEDGMFFFDIQLGREYPRSPPLCHYISYCSDRLNPNLYEDGKVCVSLLGTWSGRESEVWGVNSTLLQVIVSIQGLILVPEPYFNEAGYDKQKGTQQGKENSRMYNEMVIIKMVQATSKLIQQPPEMFREEIVDHFKRCGNSMHSRIKGWMELSKLMPNTSEEARDVMENNISHDDQHQDVPGCSKTATNLYTPPDFPLVPASRGFCITLAGLLDTFKSKLDNLYVNVGCNSTEHKANVLSDNVAASLNAANTEP